MLEVSSKITVSKEKLELLTLTLDQWVKVQLMMMMCLIVYLYIFIFRERGWSGHSLSRNGLACGTNMLLPQNLPFFPCNPHALPLP